MGRYLAVIVVVVLFLSPLVTHAELIEGKTYRLEKTVVDLERTDGSTEQFVAAYGSKFVVVDAKQGYYIVSFVDIKKLEEDTELGAQNDEFNRIKTSKKKYAERRVEYKLKNPIGDVDIAKSTSIALSGPVSGPLIVPFKYRFDDKSISGEATIGFYGGWAYDVPLYKSIRRLPVIPFLSFGLSQVAISNNGETDNKTAFTWAAGLLIKDWGNVNIGAVYGQDRVGGSTWEHEGKGWFSLMIGWSL